MAMNPSVEQALERARRAQEDRLATVQRLAEARQQLDMARLEGEQRIAAVRKEVDATIRDVTTADAKAYQAALASGWAPAELKKIGFADPHAAPRKRRARRTAGDAAAATSEAPHASGPTTSTN